MTLSPSPTWTAFQGHDILRTGPRLAVALSVKQASEGPPILVFDDATGRIVDLDLRGTEAEIAARLDAPAPRAGTKPEAPKGRGRPKLGVVSREVTLLPRHWDWLARQRGGASAALRRLVDEARKQPDADARDRDAQEAAYRVLQALAGDLPGYEEALRALFAGDAAGCAARMSDWPADLRRYALRMAFGADA